MIKNVKIYSWQHWLVLYSLMLSRLRPLFPCCDYFYYSLWLEIVHNSFPTATYNSCYSTACYYFCVLSWPLNKDHWPIRKDFIIQGLLDLYNHQNIAMVKNFNFKNFTIDFQISAKLTLFDDCLGT